jgi:hypothetical protein
MPSVYKVLGQAAPAATTDTDVYTVPSSTEAVISSITIVNRGNTAGTFRIAVRPDGDTIADRHYIAFDTPIQANDSIPLKAGITVNDSDVITVRFSSANMSVSIFGTEIS